MRRGWVIAVSVLGVLVVIFAVALASVGSHLDQERINRERLELQVDDLKYDASSASEERDRLKAQVDEQQKTIEQLKADVQRSRAQAQPLTSAPGPAATQTTPAAPTTP